MKPSIKQHFLKFMAYRGGYFSNHEKLLIAYHIALVICMGLGFYASKDMPELAAVLLGLSGLGFMLINAPVAPIGKGKRKNR